MLWFSLLFALIGSGELPVLSPSTEGQPALLEVAPVFEVLVPDDRLIERISGISWQPDVLLSRDELRLVRVSHYDFDGSVAVGELVVHAELADEVADIFRDLYGARYPIERISLIDDYGADDAASMADNNSSCLCTRPIAGTGRYSIHSYGAAIDINPVQNPYVLAGVPQPMAAAEYMDRDNPRPGMILPGDVCHTAFTSRGWIWGGDWPNPDYQHFEKPLLGTHLP